MEGFLVSVVWILPKHGPRGSGLESIQKNGSMEYRTLLFQKYVLYLELQLRGGNLSLMLVELLIHQSVEIWILQILVLLPA